MLQYNKEIAIKRWKNYGFIYAIVSFGCTFTIAVPMFTLFPAAFIEQWVGMHFKNLPIHEGLIMIFLLLAACSAAPILILRRVIKKLRMGKVMSKKEIMVYMTIYYMLVHSLFFYIYYGVFTNFASDALYLLSAIFSFPFSSGALYLIGLLTAKYINREVVVADPASAIDTAVLPD